jgi:hypothetical protein
MRLHFLDLFLKSKRLKVMIQICNGADLSGRRLWVSFNAMNWELGSDTPELLEKA